MEQIQKAIIAAAATFSGVTLLFALLLLFCRRKNPTTRRVRRPLTRTVPSSDCYSVDIGESASYDPSLNRVSMPELIQATRGFSPDLVIGDGSFGLVYKACLSSGVTVAVKKLKSDAFQGFREFRAEMDTLSKLRHPNIVQILGYCATGSDRVLIYEFIEKGSLDEWLLDTSAGDDSSTQLVPLSWDTRVKVVIGVANALNYMHNLEVPIIHRDIKTSNVLLDSQFEPHIADFGLARRMEGSNTHVSTLMAGTMGYMPPEYFYGATMATTFGDVYSFGVLMLEVATGLRPNWPFKAGEKEVRLVEWARKMVAENRHMEMLDANISREGLREGAIVEYFRIASICTNEMPKTRPLMNEVVQFLCGVSA